MHYVDKLNLPSCGKWITLLDSDDEPSPTLFTALTRNWYAVAAFKFVKRIQRCCDDTLLNSVIQLSSGSGIGPKKSLVNLYFLLRHQIINPKTRNNKTNTICYLVRVLRVSAQWTSTLGYCHRSQGSKRH